LARRGNLEILTIDKDKKNNKPADFFICFLLPFSYICKINEKPIAMENTFTIVDSESHTIDKEDDFLKPLTRELFIQNIKEAQKDLDEGKGIPFEEFQKALLETIKSV